MNRRKVWISRSLDRLHWFAWCECCDETTRSDSWQEALSLTWDHIAAAHQFWAR